MKAKVFTLALIMSFVCGIASASHVVGMRITYEYSSGSYLFKLKMYRDCYGIAAPSNVTICFNSLSGCSPSFNATLQMDIPNSGFEVPFNSCAGVGATTCNGGNVFAFEEYNYMAMVTVPPCSDWVVSYSLCCRNAAITNLVNPDTYSARVETTMDNLNFPVNSSPEFNAVPLNYYCAGIPAIIDYSAFDADGDSLSYEFTPIDGAGGCNSPFYIPFATPFTYDQPLATLVPTTFDPISGQISFTPSMLQISVIGFKVSEYRNGVLIGSVRRDDEVVVVGNFTNPDTIAGRVYYDINSNGAFDGGDIPASGTIVHLGPGNSYGTASTSGKFDFQTSSGSYTLSIPNPPLYSTVTPAVHNVNAAGAGVFYGNKDFILQSIPGMPDLEIAINSMNNPVPGMNYPVVLNYYNRGTTIQTNVEIVLTLDQNLQYTSAVPVPDNVAGNTLTWNLPVLNPFSNGIITIQTLTDSTATMGDPVICSTSIISQATDLTPGNNVDTSNDIILASYDPNDKEVTPEGDLPLSFITGQQWLHYKINFQNLGTASAQIVRVIDLLDFDLDLGSLNFVASSKPCVMTLTGPNRLEFNFFGINLPPTSVNEPASHGFVEFRIKPKSTVLPGSYITNNAHIIFDFNTPIYTNLVHNKVVTSTGISEHFQNSFDLQVYPNPSTDLVNIELVNNVNEEVLIEIFDVLGKRVFSESRQINKGQNQIEVSVNKYDSGVYFLSLTKQIGKNVTKLMID